MDGSTKKILTISIAAYNMEAFIRQALDSLADERIIDDIEVFVIDDGGTDRTLDIAKEYAAKYPNSIFPVHKENGGYGSTVNYSIARATGKYIKLLDGDDWFNTDSLVKFVKFLRHSEVDLVVTPFCNGYSESDMRPGPLDSIERNKEILISEIKSVKMPLPMWATAFKTRKIRDKWIDLPEKTFYTDTLFVLNGMAASKSLYCLEYPLYCYRRNRVGSSTNKTTITKHYREHMEIAMKNAAFYEWAKKDGCPNLVILRARAGQTYISASRAILYRRPVSLENRQLMRQYDSQLKQASYDLYKESEKYGKIGLLLKLMRRTNYFAYWLLKLWPV